MPTAGASCTATSSRPTSCSTAMAGRCSSDFNLAAVLAGPGQRRQTFGGTLHYMAPEHLAAFNPGGSSRELVDRALGHLLAGRGPVRIADRRAAVQRAVRGGDAGHRLYCTARTGNAQPPPLRPRQRRPDDPGNAGPRSSAAVWSRKPAGALPAGRSELEEALEGCRELQQWEQAIFPPQPAADPAVPSGFPVLMLIVPVRSCRTCSASARSTSLYNTLGRGFTVSSPRQQEVFNRSVLGLQRLVDPLCTGSSLPGDGAGRAA